MSGASLFMELVQAHERGWGMEQYAGRPSLNDMLTRPIVVFWSGDDKTNKGRFTVTVHNHTQELDTILLNMILSSKVTPSSNRRLARIFVKQEPVKITGLHLQLSRPDQR